MRFSVEKGHTTTMRVTVRWTDEAGDHEEPFTLQTYYEAPPRAGGAVRSISTTLEAGPQGGDSTTPTGTVSPNGHSASRPYNTNRHVDEQFT
jgi:hypothetical protein